jgi:Protein of unknown function (DUF4230)
MKWGYIFLVGICLCGAISCSKSPAEQKQSILALREMSDLVTVEYVVTKIIKANDNQTWYKAGDRKILMSCRASIKAGIDLSAIQADNINLTDKSITLQIPPAKIIALDMPAENIVVEYQDIDLFRSPFKAGERDALAAQAEAQIRSGTEAMGLLQSAEANAKQVLTDFLKRLGYTDIIIQTASNQLNNNKKD